MFKVILYLKHQRVLQKSDLGRKVNKHKPRSGKINRGMKKTEEDPQDVPPNL